MEILDENAPFGAWANLWERKKDVGMKWAYCRNIRCYLNHLKPLYDIPISKVRTMHIETIIADLTKENPTTKKPSSKKLLKEVKHTARSVVDYAINNCDGFYKNRVVSVEIPTNAPKTERKALSENEQRLVFTTHHRAKVPALIMMLCGLRVGEMIALTWDNIDFENEVINVCQSAYNINSNDLAIQNTTKNGKTRKVTIPHLLIALLKKHKENSKGVFVTTKVNGIDMHSRSSWRRMWESYTTAVGASFTAHQLRHTYASMLYAAGVDVKSASELLGHSDIQITIKIYTHLSEKRKKISVDLYEKYIMKNYPEIQH